MQKPLTTWGPFSLPPTPTLQTGVSPLAASAENKHRGAALRCLRATDQGSRQLWTPLALQAGPLAPSLLPAASPFLKQDGLLHTLGVSSPGG